MARDRKIAFIVFVAALLVRLLYLYESAGSPFFAQPVLDELYLDNLALDIAAGDDVTGDESFRAPLYPALLGAVYSVDSGPGRFFLVKMLQHLLGALTCALLFLVARDAAGTAAGIATGALAIFYGPLIFYEGEVLIVTLFIFLNSLSLYLYSAAARRGSRLLVVAGGAALALSVITRPNIMLFVPAVCLWTFLAFRKERPVRRFVTAGLSVLPVVLVIVAMCAWNYSRTGSFVVVSSQGGVNFYIGNGADATGMPPTTRKTYGAVERYRDNIEVSSRTVVEKAAQAEQSPDKLSDFWYGLARKDISEGKLAWMKLMFKKTVLFWNNYEVKNNRNLYFARRYSLLLRIVPLSFGVLTVLGLCGAVLLAARSPLGTGGLLVLYAATFMASIVMFFVCARLRLPVVAALLPAAGVALSHLVATARQYPRRLLLWAIALAALACLTFVDWYSVSSNDFSAEYWLEGKVYFDLARYEEAAESFESSIQHDPDFPGSRLYLGNCYLQAGDTGRARDAYAGVLELDALNPRAINGLGACAEREGNLDGAAAYYRQAMEAGPGFAKPITNLGVLLVKTGDLEEGKRMLDQSLSLDRTDPEAYFGLALHAGVAGKDAEREKYLQEAVARGGEEYREFLKQALLEVQPRSE